MPAYSGDSSEPEAPPGAPAKTTDAGVPAIERTIESRSPVTIDVRRTLVWAISGLGCVTLPVVAITGVIAYADYSVAKSEQTNVVGIITVLAWVLGIALLIRIIRAWPRRG